MLNLDEVDLFGLRNFQKLKNDASWEVGPGALLCKSIYSHELELTPPLEEKREVFFSDSIC